MAIGFSGCASNPFVAPPLSGGAEAGGLLPVSAFADDIQDIVLPAEMEWVRKDTMAIKSESFRGGIWKYKGRLEVIGLKDYMINSMQDNKWKLVGESVSKEIVLAFVKPNKTCMIVLGDSFNGSTLTLYVTNDKTAAAGLNPFGEPVSQ